MDGKLTSEGKGKGKGYKDWRGRTVADDLAAHEDESEDNIQDARRGQLVRAMRDPYVCTPGSAPSTSSGASTASATLVCGRRMFDEDGIERRAKYVCLGTLRDGCTTNNPNQTGKRACATNQSINQSEHISQSIFAQAHTFSS